MKNSTDDTITKQGWGGGEW